MVYLIGSILGIILGIWVLVAFAAILLKIVGIVILALAVYGLYVFFTGRRRSRL